MYHSVGSDRVSQMTGGHRHERSAAHDPMTDALSVHCILPVTQGGFAGQSGSQRHLESRGGGLHTSKVPEARTLFTPAATAVSPMKEPNQ